LRDLQRSVSIFVQHPTSIGAVQVGVEMLKTISPSRATGQCDHNDDRDQPSTKDMTAHLPTSGFLRLQQVKQFVPISRSTLYQKMKLGTFPRPVKLGPRISAWRVEDIRNYITNPR